nr:glycosyltransferase family 4 protein [Marivirga aurantiaca]
MRTTYGINEDITIIGNSSAIAPHKDYFTFVDTARHMVENISKKVHFFIIGKGPLENEIRAYITQSKMDEYITMTGFLQNINEVLPSLDIFFISSETEGLGTSIIDAFASKVPVVATAAGGIPELVKHEQTGLLAPVRDTEMLATLINKMILDKELRNNMIENAWNLSLEFSKKAMAENYYRLYNEILNK